MRRWTFSFLVLTAPAFAQSGQLTLAPASITVANAQQGVEMLITYVPRPNVAALEAEYAVNLDRFSWAEVQPDPAPTPGYETRCHVAGGNVRVLVHADGAALPAGRPIAACRLRVRAHAHAQRGRYTIGPVFAWELEPLYVITTPVTNSARIFVP